MSNFATNDAGVDVRGVGRDIFEYREGDRILRSGRQGAVTDSGDPAQVVYIDRFLR